MGPVKTQKQLRDGRRDCQGQKRRGLEAKNQKSLLQQMGKLRSRGARGLTKTRGRTLCSQSPSYPPCLHSRKQQNFTTNRQLPVGRQWGQGGESHENARSWDWNTLEIVPHFPWRRVKILSWRLSVTMTTFLFPHISYFLTFMRGTLTRERTGTHQTCSLSTPPSSITNLTVTSFELSAPLVTHLAKGRSSALSHQAAPLGRGYVSISLHPWGYMNCYLNGGFN